MKLKIKDYFTKFELGLLCTSYVAIFLSFFIFDRENYIMLISSLIGVTSLIFNAKGNPIGQALIIIFSILYGIISFSFSYYGEMLTYLGMTTPMAIVALISWLRNPYNGNNLTVKTVKIEQIKLREIPFIAVVSLIVTFAMYYILKLFNTANIIPSTISVLTSFVAAYLTYKRTPYFALAYAANDIVLIILWILASISDISYASLFFCFIVFLVNDIYGYCNWKRMEIQQSR